MENKDSAVNFEEVLDTEIDDIWDIFFPYMTEKKEKLQKLDRDEPAKPRRHMRFIAM